MSLIDPVTWSKSWVLSGEKVKNPVSISHEVFKNFGKQDVIAVDFIYQSYLKQLNGVILNEEDDLNTHLQVSSCLGALYNSLKSKFLVLILCPDDLIIKWHYYISQCSQLEVKIINPNTVPEDFDQDTGIVLLLSFTNIKLAEYLKEYDLFSVVIDNFDKVATKLVIRKLKGIFNIGITPRNFYMDPDQKLKWTMLNWANPGCLGKLADFYKIDNDNIANFRDNYTEWWFRLTWDFCDSFVKPTLEEKGHLNSVLREWAKRHNLVTFQFSDNKYNKRKRKSQASSEISEESVESEDNKQNRRTKRVYKKNDRTTKSFNKIPYKHSSKGSNAKNQEKFRNLNLSSDSSDSNDNIIYEDKSKTNLEDDAMGAPENDEPPIGGSLKNNCRKLETEMPVAQNEKPEDKCEVDTESIPSEQLLSFQVETKKKKLLKNNCDEDLSADDKDSVSSGEQLLYSLAGTKEKKSVKNAKRVTDCQNELGNFDESDLFLKSVVSTKSDLSPFKNRQKSDKFFDKILEPSSDKPALNSLTLMEMELTEKEVFDVPSESDSFFKGIFSDKNHASDKTGDKEKVDCGASSSNAHIDVDSLVAEVMKMVEKK